MRVYVLHTIHKVQQVLGDQYEMASQRNIRI